MCAAVANQVGHVVVITQGNPIPGAAAITVQQFPNVVIQSFIRGRPQVLGTIQILMGLIIMLFGFAGIPRADSLLVYSGIFVWGAILYITAGSLTVAAGNRPTRCLINGALGVSVVSALAATAGVILHGLDAAVMFYCYSSDGWNDCLQYKNRMEGFSSVLAVFNLLELVVAITVASFACSATCNNCCNDSPVVVTVPAQAGVGIQSEQGFQNHQTDPPHYSSVMNN